MGRPGGLPRERLSDRRLEADGPQAGRRGGGRRASPSGRRDPSRGQAAQPLVDVSRIRERLLQFGWVSDARVSRRLPDTLVIDIVERTPAALWQDRQQLALIDAEGVVLDRVPVHDMPDLPLLIGPGANTRARDLNRAGGCAGAFSRSSPSASRVSGRRWDLSFSRARRSRFPKAMRPLAPRSSRFADLDRSNGLLGRGLVRLDLRVPGKMIVRVPRAPGEPIFPEAPRRRRDKSTAVASPTDQPDRSARHRLLQGRGADLHARRRQPPAGARHRPARKPRGQARLHHRHGSERACGAPKRSSLPSACRRTIEVWARRGQPVERSGQCRGRARRPQDRAV